jgi:hypothetical protein
VLEIPASPNPFSKSNFHTNFGIGVCVGVGVIVGVGVRVGVLVAVGILVGERVTVGVDVGMSVRVGVTVGTCTVAVVGTTCGWGVAVGTHETVRPKRMIVANDKRFIFASCGAQLPNRKGIGLSTRLTPLAA